MTVDEALLELDRFLNDAYLAGLYQVSIVHGKGTGTLRREMRSRLARHPLVRRFRGGEPCEGGDGVTVVELALR